MILTKAKSERGSAFILALMVVAAVGLLVVPVIYLATTGLRSTNLAQHRFLERYAVDAGVEEGIWIVQYDTLYVADPDADAPPAIYNSTFNSLPTSIEIKPVIRPTMSVPILSSTQSGGNMAIHKIVDPQYVAPCPNSCDIDFTYTIFIENFGQTEIHLDEIGDCLPKGFTFLRVTEVNGIFENPAPQQEFDLAILESYRIDPPIRNDEAAPWPCTGDRWQVRWDFGSAPPFITSSSMAEIKIDVSGKISGPAEHLNEAWIEVKSNAFPVPIPLDEPVPVIVECPMSDISSTAGGTTVKTRITLCETPSGPSESYIVSWQVE